MGGFLRGADADTVTATSANGVVTIPVPNKPEIHQKQIAVTPRKD
ncbi:alpha-crystallin domain-containing protein [Limnoglobus roseus]|nr:Hsp20 family protein [Limnoglobus roseus]